MSKFKNLSTDYRQILAKASVSDRVKIAKSSFAQEILSQLPPSELARLFPKYYRDKIPAISKAYYGDFTSQSYSGSSSSTAATPSQSISVPSTTTTQTTQQSTTKKSDDKSKPAWFNKIMEGSSTNIPSAQLEKQSRGLAHLRQQRFGKIDDQTIEAIAAMGKTEVGGMTSRSKQQWLETVVNRAYIQNRSLQGFTKKTKGSYWQSSGKKVSKEDISEWRGYLNNVMAGSNITNGMTDNASNDYRRGNELANKRHASGREGYWSEGTTGDFEKDKDKGEFLYNDFRFKKGRRAMLDEAEAYEKNNPSAILKQPNNTGKINPSNNADSVIADAWAGKISANSKVVENAMKMKGLTTRQNRQELENYLKSGGKGATTRDNWCAYFVNASLQQSGIKGTNSGAAGSFHKWGKTIDKPEDVQSGQVLVNKKRSKNTGMIGSHVVIASGPAFKKNGQWYVPTIGGNQKGKDGSQGVTSYDVPLSQWVVKAPTENDYFDTTTAVPALPDNIPQNVRDEINKLSVEDQEAVRQKLEQLGPTGIETITRAIEESPSPKAAEAAVEAVQSATPAQIQKLSIGEDDYNYKVWEGLKIPTSEERKKIQESGGSYISLDTNSVSNKKPTQPLIIIPNNATKEQRARAQEYVDGLAKHSNEKFGTKYKGIVKTQKENNGGRDNTFHTEPFAVYDKNAVEYYTQSPEGREWFAKHTANTLGKMPGAEFSLPHLNSKGKYNPDAQGAVGPWGSEVDLANPLVQDLRALKEAAAQQRMQVEAAKSDPSAIIPQNSQTGVINPGPNGPTQAPQSAPQAVSGSVPTQTAPQVSAPVAPSTAVPVEPSKNTGKAVGRAAGESPTKITPKIDVKPSQSSPSVPLMKTGGEVQASGEDFSIVDNNSKRKLGEVSRGENIKFNTKGRVEVTPDQRIDPRALEAAQEVRQEHHERVVDNNKQEMPQATMMQGARVPEKAPTQFTSYEQWGHTETPASYVRAMAQAKGRKHDGSFPGSRFGEEQLSAL